jgi:hypothetical protein
MKINVNWKCKLSRVNKNLIILLQYNLLFNTKKITDFIFDLYIIC